MRGKFLAGVALTAMLAVACGSGHLPTMDGDAASKLDRQVAAVRYAVLSRDADAAARALETLQTTVGEYRRSGQVSPAKAREILSAATAVQGQLVSITTTTTTTTLPPAPATKPGRGPKPETEDGKHGPH